MSESIKVAMLARVPEFEASFARHYLAAWDGASHCGVRKVPAYPESGDSRYLLIRNLLREVCDMWSDGINGPAPVISGSAPSHEFMRFRLAAWFELNMAKVEARSRKAAEEAALAWYHKAVAKLGDVSDAAVSGAGARIRIAGKRAGRVVILDQEMIVNVSVKGKLFNQFPARLYVDGKFVPAGEYAAVFS